MNTSADIKRAAAVCYKRTGGELHFLLVRTSSLSHWIFPKGKQKPGEKLWAAAEREAYEEAGVRGRINREQLADFLYSKDNEEMTVTAFLLKVDSLEPPEVEFRKPTWFSQDEAGVMLSQNRSAEHAADLVAVLEKACTALDTRTDDPCS